MIHYVILAIYFIFILLSAKIFMIEMMNRQLSKKQVGLTYYLSFSKSFQYRKPTSTVFLCVLLYGNTSTQTAFSMLWLLELTIFMALMAIADMLSQFLSFMYGKYRFSKKIQSIIHFIEDTNTLLKNNVVNEPTVSPKQFSLKSTIEKHVKASDHVGIIGTNLNTFVHDLNLKSAVNYVLDQDKEVKEDDFKDGTYRNVEILDDGRLPFKDHKLDVLVTHYDLYDFEEFYRVLKPGGILIFENPGCSHFQELTKIFNPRMVSKTTWGVEEVVEDMLVEGFEAIDHDCCIGDIKYESILSLKKNVSSYFNIELTNDVRLMDFYHYISYVIETKGAFIDQYDAMLIVARKEELKGENNNEE